MRVGGGLVLGSWFFVHGWREMISGYWKLKIAEWLGARGLMVVAGVLPGRE